MSATILRRLAALFLLALAITSLTSCGPKTVSPPKVGTQDFDKLVTSFYVALAATDVGDNDRANRLWQELTTSVPDEPAVWANYAIIALRLSQYDEALKRLATAQKLAPQNSIVHSLIGQTESRRGRTVEAIDSFRKAFALDPKNSRGGWALYKELERLGDEKAMAEAITVLDGLLRTYSTNIPILIERARQAAKANDMATVPPLVESLERVSGGWPANCKAKLQQVKASFANSRQTAIQLQGLNSILLPEPQRRADFYLLEAPTLTPGEPIDKPISFQAPASAPAAPDMALQFASPPGAPILPPGARLLTAASLDGEQLPALVSTDRDTVSVGGFTMAMPGGFTIGKGPSSTAILDWNDDFHQDLAVGGEKGILFLQSDVAGGFHNVNAATKLPANILSTPVAGLWAIDIEPDGDLDLLVAPVRGAPFVLQNNGDGTWKQTFPIKGVVNVRAFAYADIDGDGDNDLALVDDKGTPWFYRNDRGGLYVRVQVPERITKVAALTVGDSDQDGKLDFIVLDMGVIYHVSTDVAKKWIAKSITTWPGGGGGFFPNPSIFAEDLDNNGSIDLVASNGVETRVWLSDDKAVFTQLPAAIPGSVVAIDNMDADGRVDIVCAGPNAILKNTGTKSYGWQTLLPRRVKANGDQRINTFGIGGEVAGRAALLAMRRPIRGPKVHFGLGERKQIDVAMISWPSGYLQAEFDLAAGKPTIAEQRLQGSCPWVFAWNGHEMAFVTDFIWRSPLGMRINAQTTAGITQTDDWVRIRGDQLVPRDGKLDLRITAELCETHFFDYVALRACDHPADVEVFVDERFTFGRLPLQFHAVKSPQSFAKVVDDQGGDVAAIVRDLDQQYLDTFGRGRYQGVTRDHWVTVELPESAPRDKKLVLLAQGWIRPTDSSINIALSQGNHAPPKGLSLEVEQPNGVWKVVAPSLGFPEGKNKTSVIDLDGVFPASGPRRARLRTNLEIYWDKLAWAERVPNTELRQQVLPARSMTLRPRGYSAVSWANSSSPELPDYSSVSTHPHRWRDLEGFHTRFGDVNELLNKTDDRFVIMNAGDEIALLFDALPPPPAGWKRDYALMGDGWVKDGNFGTAFSATVLPLPFHGMKEYSKAPGRLEDDPIYRKYVSDWSLYHTRYVSADGAGSLNSR
jgi:tetratricopeptide (TPR) repeat protein